MTQKQFDTQIRRLVNRAFLLREVQDGKAKLCRIDVKECVVPEHTRSAHTRLIAPKGWLHPPESRRGAEQEERRARKSKR